MRTTSLRATSHLFHQALATTGEFARESRALRRAAKRMPKPVPWEWAEPRLLPLLSGPAVDPPGEALVRARSDLGPMVEIGVDLGGVFTFVDEAVAQRWECSPQQLMDRGLRNLADRAARLQTSQVAAGVMSGRAIRLLRDRPNWASSLVLVPEHLVRLFGSHDQIIGAPQQACLVSLPIDTPAPIAADIIIEFEQTARRSLWLDPFVVLDGQLSWCGGADEDDGDW